MRHLTAFGTVRLGIPGQGRDARPAAESSIGRCVDHRALLVENLRGLLVGALGALIWLLLGSGFGP